MGTQVIKHNDLKLKIELLDDIYDPSIQEKFESGALLVFDSFALLDDIDFDFIAMIPKLESSHLLKKAKEKHLFAPLAPDSFPSHILSNYVKNHVDGLKLQNIFIEVKRRFRDYLCKVFPGYKVTQYETAWRFTETTHENMHFDVYYHPATFYVRMFTNLSSEPRIWHCSYTFNEAMEQVSPEIIRNAKPNNICKLMNRELFGPEISGPLNTELGFRFPYTEISFPMGTVWLGHSQFISHQIMSGSKMMSVNLFVESNSMRKDNLWIDNLYKKAQETCV